MSTCLVGLGSNLGDRQRLLCDAIDRLAGHPEITVSRRSHFYETPAVGGPAGQDTFLNAVIRLETSLQPAELHQQLLRVENRLGRQRRVRWAARTVDLDLLLYDDQQIDTAELTVPHPRMALRSFVLAPAAEIAGEMIHPGVGWSLDKLWRHITSTPRYVAITGRPGAGQTRLANQVAERLQQQHQINVQCVADTIPDDLRDSFYHDPGGHGGRAAIELLRLRQAALEGAVTRARAGDKSSPWLISDFWSAESLAFADPFLDAAGRDEMEQAWQSAGENIVQPTLLVLLTAEMDRRVAADQPPTRAREDYLTPDMPARMQQSLVRRVEDRHAGPRMTLSNRRWQATVDEVTAAVLAMEFEPIRR
jgi:2-amino-4-hydroxy-6-hydroxymethyldihydropteridine diphosphokinase